MRKRNLISNEKEEFDQYERGLGAVGEGGVGKSG